MQNDHSYVTTMIFESKNNNIIKNNRKTFLFNDKMLCWVCLESMKMSAYIIYNTPIEENINTNKMPDPNKYIPLVIIYFKSTYNKDKDLQYESSLKSIYKIEYIDINSWNANNINIEDISTYPTIKVIEEENDDNKI